MKISETPLYDGEPLPFSLTPVTLKRKDCDFIENALTEVLKTAETFTARAVQDEKILHALGIRSVVDPRPTPLGLHIPFARFDFLYDGENLNILELNTDGTSGFNLMEWLALKAEIKDSENPNKDLSHRLLAALRAHKPEASEVGLLDFPGVKTSWEQKDLIETWSKVLPSKLLNPGVRTWSKGSLIYRRALSWQLSFNSQRALPFLADWKAGAVTVVGGWSSDVGMSKAWPALTKVEYFPETLIADEKTCLRLRDEKDFWILKGALSYAGKAIIRGIDLSNEKWRASLEKVALETDSGRPWVAQRFVTVPLVEGAPCEFGLYFLNGRPSGYMCRWGSTDAISDKSSELMRPVRIIS